MGIHCPKSLESINFLSIAIRPILIDLYIEIKNQYKKNICAYIQLKFYIQVQKIYVYIKYLLMKTE
jgi:hypothetical protein